MREIIAAGVAATVDAAVIPKRKKINKKIEEGVSDDYWMRPLVISNIVGDLCTDFAMGCRHG